jgi:hypothetical protein
MLLRRRSLSFLALLLAVVTLAVSARGLYARPVQIPRWQTSKRAHVPRHVIPQAAFEVSRRGSDVRRTRAEVDRLSCESLLASSSVLLGSTLPDQAAVELAKPRYLRLLDGPHRQTSPPA